MMQLYKKELEQEPFDPEEFVERLAWRTIDSNRGGGNGTFDPVLMHQTFSEAIRDLELLLEQQHKQCEILEKNCKAEEIIHWQCISKLQENNKSTVNLFQELDERINFVATKVIHLGEQLESVNTPRSRAVQAQKLMSHFSEYLSPGPILPEVIQDFQIDEEADIIQKLYLIAQELPPGKFEEAKKTIAVKYDEIEKALIEQFVVSHYKNDIGRMREIASILSHFKGYSQCVDAFIEQSQLKTFGGKDVFCDIIPMCENNFYLMSEIFNNPEQVMCKFVLNIYHFKLQKYIVGKLSDKSDTDRYLKNLMELYTRTEQLSKDLSRFNLGSDNMYMSKLTRNIFQKYFDSYISLETKNFKEKCAEVLSQYYDSKGHQKRLLQGGGFQDLRRDLQAVIGTRANINIAQIEDHGGETFLSEEVAIAILQEAKITFQRCQVLSQPIELADNAVHIMDVLMDQLMIEHLEYGIELGLQAIPIPETKSQKPQVYFFKIVSQANAIVHLVEKHFSDCIIPIVKSTPKYIECLQLKKRKLESIEMKLNTGLDRSINAVVGEVKIILQSNQKKTDFCPETDVDTVASTACSLVVNYLTSGIAYIRNSLDGKNIEFVMCELGTRFHRVIYEHLLQFTYNTAGVMCAICDVNEYRKCVKEFKSSLVTTLFDTLHGLCNLLLVKPENLNQVCTGDTLAGLDHSILLNFIQLRSDFKTQRLGSFLKGLAT